MSGSRTDDHRAAPGPAPAPPARMSIPPASGRSSPEGSILRCSLEALREGRALGLLAAALVLATVLGAVAARAPVPAGIALVLLALAATFYGVHAAGILMADAVAGIPRPPGAALRLALAGGHRWLGVLLLAVAAALGGLLVVAALLTAARLPGVGPAVFAVAFPVGALVVTLLLLALPLVVVPLSGPPAWQGADPALGLVTLWRQRGQGLDRVLVPMAGVCCLVAVVAALAHGVAWIAATGVARLSCTLLGAATAGRLLSALDLPGLAGPLPPGGSVIWAAVAAAPLLVYLRGACEVHRRLGGAEAPAPAPPAAAPAPHVMVPPAPRVEPPPAAAGILAAPESKPPCLATTVTMLRHPDEPGGGGVDVELPLELPAMVQAGPACPHCGSRVVAGVRFCGGCGGRLVGARGPG